MVGRIEMHVHGRDLDIDPQTVINRVQGILWYRYFDRSSRTGSTGGMSQISWAELCGLPQYVRVVENMDPVNSCRQSHSL
jgi:hypothetical protein